MAINARWHETYKMPRNATLDQRLDWYLAHAANCECREMPDRIRRELEARGLIGPTIRSLK
jgi:hypothetical protein